MFTRRTVYGKFEELVRLMLQKLGFKTYLVDAHPSPDIIAFKNGRIYLIEVKYGSNIRQDQLDFLVELCREIKNCGARCIPTLAKREDDCRVVLYSLPNFEKVLELELCVDED